MIYRIGRSREQCPAGVAHSDFCSGLRACNFSSLQPSEGLLPPSAEGARGSAVLSPQRYIRRGGRTCNGYKVPRNGPISLSTDGSHAALEAEGSFYFRSCCGSTFGERDCEFGRIVNLSRLMGISFFLGVLL